MNLDTEQLMMMGAVCVAVYIAGYPGLAIGIFILLVISSVLMAPKRIVAKGVSTAGVRVHGAETLEPIIIETTRGPPFRIPSFMNIRVRPNWGGDTWVEKAMGKGAGRAARLGHRVFGGSSYE
ncbi:MAG: hypothetical protein KAW41_04380 [Candidatus Diapherotrites archaeon]|nr:hypothetical protein [Candidatus Diapherotrites archaeon]